MKRTLCLILGACLLMTGCGGNAQQSSTPLKESVEAKQTEDAVQTSLAEESSEESSAPVVVVTEDSSAAETQETLPASETDEAVGTAEQTDAYAEMITAFDNEYLGLPQKDKVYIFQSTGATTQMNDAVYHAVSCYDEYEGTLYYMCDFYIAEDGTEVYRYYLSEDRYALLPEAVGFEQMDPSTQEPEEIFAVANELYGYFAVSSLPCSYENVLEFEVDGEMYPFYMVTDERLDTKMELIEALSCYFSMEIINSLMDSSFYRDGPDGKLYTSDGARGTDIFYVGTEYELTLLIGDTAEFTAYNTYGYENGETEVEEYVYNAVKQDGRWMFTNFELPY